MESTAEPDDPREGASPSPTARGQPVRHGGRPPAEGPRPRRRSALLAAAIVLLLAADLTRPAADQLSARALLAAIDLYQATLSSRCDRAGVRCRFRPTCSHYGEAVIRRDGALVGSLEAGWRILRCGPWTPAGTVDPP